MCPHTATEHDTDRLILSEWGLNELFTSYQLLKDTPIEKNTEWSFIVFWVQLLFYQWEESHLNFIVQLFDDNKGILILI